MRQSQEVGITMAISLNSFILLLLSILGGMATLWKDIERKQVYTLLSFPISRSNYFLGRFLGCTMLLLTVCIINFSISVIAIKICASMYKSRLPILWENIAISFLFSFFKYTLLLAIGFLFASFSTSFFMPLFITIGTYIGGNSIQSIYEYVMRDESSNYSLFFKLVIKFIYYILPNFSSFDFTVYAAYALKIDLISLSYTSCYFIIYLLIVLSLSCIIFTKRDLI